MTRRILWAAFISIPVFWLVWSLTAKAQGTSSLGWGTIVTAKDQGAADLLGFKAPGTYIGIRDGTNLSAVRGGLKLIFSFSDLDLGFRALASSRIFASADGYIFVGTGVLWLMVMILLILGRKSRSREA